MKTNDYVAFIIERKPMIILLLLLNESQCVFLVKIKPMFVASIIEGKPMILLFSLLNES
jgi:hypothetical protein